MTPTPACLFPLGAREKAEGPLGGNHTFDFISVGARLVASDRNASDRASSNELEEMEFTGSSP